MMRLVIATHNRAKAGEMLTILSSALPDLEFLTLADYPLAPEPEETGNSYSENAAIKALSAAAFTGEWSIADDAGLEIDALAGAPGVHSKRFEGAETPFPLKMARILEALRLTPEPERSARFRCAVALAEPGHPPIGFESTCEGEIAYEPKGEGGFGYDPIFYLRELERTMAQLSPEEKHAISHRGNVLRQVIEFLKPRIG